MVRPDNFDVYYKTKIALKTDRYTTVINPVISQKMGAAKLTSMLVQSHGFKKFN